MKEGTHMRGHMHMHERESRQGGGGERKKMRERMGQMAFVTPGKDSLLEIGLERNLNDAFIWIF